MQGKRNNKIDQTSYNYMRKVDLPPPLLHFINDPPLQF